MLDTLNLNPIEPLKVRNDLRDSLTPVCYITVSHLKGSFSIDNAFTAFFEDAIAEALKADGKATVEDKICLRQDANSNIISFTLQGQDGCKKRGVAYSSSSINMAEEIASLNLRANARIELFKASDFTLIGRVMHDHTTDDPFLAFTELLESVYKDIKDHPVKRAKTLQAVQKLIGSEEQHLGGNQQARLEAKRILLNVRTSIGLQKPAKAFDEADLERILEVIASFISEDHYYRPESQTYIVDKRNLALLVDLVAHMVGASINYNAVQQQINGNLTARQNFKADILHNMIKYTQAK